MRKIDKIFDAAGLVLEATIRDQELAEEAIKNLNDAVKNLESRNRELRIQIQQEVKNSLDFSVRSAVNDLIKKFQVADSYAEKAASRYEQAIRDYDQRKRDHFMNIIISFCIGLVVGGGGVIVWWFLK